MCWFVARKSFCQLEREFIMGISTSNHKIKKQDEAINNKRLVSLGFQMCQCCFPPSSPHFTPSASPVVTRQGARSQAAAGCSAQGENNEQ